MFKEQFSYIDAVVLVAIGFAGGKWGLGAMIGVATVGAVVPVLLDMAWRSRARKHIVPVPCRGRQIIHGDLTTCSCGSAWDTNDPHPPAGH